VKELQQRLALEASEHPLVVNLQDVTLVNQDAVKCLAQCEAIGITLEHWPRHTRRWIDQSEGRIK